jgi:hypothetical protein
MAKKIEKASVVNIKSLALKNPKSFIEGLTTAAEGLEFTKVIQTYVFENTLLKLVLFKDGKSFFSGTIKWIGNIESSPDGSAICVDSGNDLKIILPNDDNTQDIIFEPDKYLIRLETTSKTRCSVCGKGLEIFDDLRSCPICNAKSHSDHLVEWVKMRHSCPICKKELVLDDRDNIRQKE